MELRASEADAGNAANAANLCFVSLIRLVCARFHLSQLLAEVFWRAPGLAAAVYRAPEASVGAPVAFHGRRSARSLPRRGDFTCSILMMEPEAHTRLR